MKSLTRRTWMQKGMVAPSNSRLTWSSVVCFWRLKPDEMLIELAFQLILKRRGRAEKTAKTLHHRNPRYPPSSRRSTLFTLYLLKHRSQTTISATKSMIHQILSLGISPFRRRLGRSWALGIFISLFSIGSFLFERRRSSVSSERARLRHSSCHYRADKRAVTPVTFMRFTDTKMPWRCYR